MMKCLICGNDRFSCVHKGTRDVQKLNVMRCTTCGMVQLDCQDYNTEENYEAGGMLVGTYSAIADKVEDKKWTTWIKETESDDDRRYKALKETCRGKKVLEFGCGNGGFLRRIRSVALGVTGIELMDEARENIRKEGISVYKSLDETKETYDIICMFNVIEHLNSPDEVLNKCAKALKKDGLFVCETVNVDCALSSKYLCEAYNDFTYWSEHVILFNSETLEKLINRNGFQTIKNTQMERYSLGNHLYWLANGKPGGHMKWTEFNDEELNALYEKILVDRGIADTLWYVGKKN